MADVREEWYETDGTVTLSLLCRGVQRDSLCVEQTDAIVTVRFVRGDGTAYERVLRPYAPVTSATGSVSSTRVEVRMHKASHTHWPALESGVQTLQTDVPPTYPTSSRAKHDWAAVEREADAQAHDAAGVEAFFQKLYAGADEDTRRAMVKSYVESKGTVLSTNWADVGSRRVDTARPPGFDVSKT